MQYRSDRTKRKPNEETQMSRDDDEATAQVAVTENPGNVTSEAQPTEGSTTEQAVPNQTEQAAPAETKPEGPTDAEQAEAFENFKAKVATAVDQVDQSTGTVPDGPVAEVKAAYVALPLPKNKTAARNLLDQGMKDSLTKDLNPFKAKAYLDLTEACKSTGGSREQVARPPVDPTEAFVKTVASHWIATSLLIPGPDVKADYVQQAQQLSQSLQGEAKAFKEYQQAHNAWAAKPEAERGEEPKAPEVSEVVITAARIAYGRGTKRAARTSDGTSTPRATNTGAGYAGPRRDVKKHIVSAFKDLPVGAFLKIGEITKHKSDEYGEDSPSGGAVNSALASAKFAAAVPNIVAATEGGVNGARKTA